MGFRHGRPRLLESSKSLAFGSHGRSLAVGFLTELTREAARILITLYDVPKMARNTMGPELRIANENSGGQRSPWQGWVAYDSLLHNPHRIGLIGPGILSKWVGALKTTEDVSNCWRCGECCLTLISGVRVTPQEWQALEKDIAELGLAPATICEAKRSLRLPATGKCGVKRCVFLGPGNLCQVYAKRPEECRHFPVWVIDGQKAVTFVVSHICPRAERLAARLKANLPDWAGRLVEDKRYRIVAV